MCVCVLYCGGHHYSDSTAFLVMVSQAETIVLLIPSCYYTLPNKDFKVFFLPVVPPSMKHAILPSKLLVAANMYAHKCANINLRFVVRSMHLPCFQQKCVNLACCSPNNTIIDIASEAVRKEEVYGHDFANVMK